MIVIYVFLVVLVLFITYGIASSLKNLQKTKFKFFEDYLLMGDGEKLLFKNTLSITMNRLIDYYPTPNWRPIVLLKYQHNTKEMQLQIPFKYLAKSWYYLNLGIFVDNQRLRELATHLPEKTDENIKKALRGEEVLITDLPPLSKEAILFPPTGKVVLR